MVEPKVPDEAIQADLDAGMSLKDIAEKYDLSLMTVLKRKRRLESKNDPNYKAKKPKEKKTLQETRGATRLKPPSIKPFTLNVGDFIKDIETEVSRDTVNTYQVVKIYDTYFVCEKISGKGHWKTAFLKIDWQLGLTGKRRTEAEGRKDDDSKD